MQKLLKNTGLNSTMSEILAPAGGKNSALAAINSGADAIYLGLSDFSARSGAENFDGGSFKEICRYAHAFNVKVYAALNTLIKDGELEDFIRTVVSAWNDGADAIIMQDIFLGKFIHERYPDIVLHLSTQAGCCNVYGARLAKKFGFERVILARETKLADIREIAGIIETEVFVQGALCTCFSGQCYMSSFAGGNSGNRGKCKQPCRKMYSLDRAGFEERAYRLSLSDLSVGKNISELVGAGVKSFKIEGRMRRPEYVAAAVKYYRDLIDGNGAASLSDLKRTFNRGNYTSGLAFGQGKSFISSAVQGHIGEFVGIIKVENGRYICRTEQRFFKGDGFKVLRDGREVGGGAYAGEVKNGFIVTSRDRLRNGDKVFVTTDTKLNERLLSAKRLITLNISANFSAGKRAHIIINEKNFYSEQPLDCAVSRPLSEDDIKSCFLKVDNYPFEIKFGSIFTDGVFIASSQLNALRRRVFAEYYGEISAAPCRNYGVKSDIPQITGENNVKTAVICGCLQGVTADIGILKPDDYSCVSDDGFRGEKFLYVPPYVSGAEIEMISAAAAGFDGIYCDGYFGLELAESLNKKFFAGTGFNLTNSISVKLLESDYFCLSKELTRRESEKLSTENSFCLTAGNIKVMDLIYCPFEKKCSSCDKRIRYTLTDENGRKFPLRRYNVSECRFEVYNCADLATETEGVGRLYDCSLESCDTAEKLVRGHAPEQIFENYTRGHFNSRIL